MKINDSLFKQVTETSYLSTENTWRYRSIVRFFYLEYEKMNYSLYKEDVFKEFKSHEQFSEYTIDMLTQDLDKLVSWKNLNAVQDTSRVASYADFKNRRFRYQLNDYTISFERLVMRLENTVTENSSLDPHLLEKLKNQIQQTIEIVDKDISTVGVWWEELMSIFETLNQKYQDYLKDFYSIKAEDIMKSTEFLVFKDRFVDYLRDFIKGLQSNSSRVETVLRNIDDKCADILLQKVLDYQLQQRKLNITKLDSPIDEELIKENIQGRWESIKNWFIDSGNRISDSNKIMEITNDIILRITRYAYQILENRNTKISKKDEYNHLIKMFLKCEDIMDAHKLSAYSFGVFNTRHLCGSMERITDSTNSSIYDEPPHVIQLNPRIRTFKQREVRNPAINNSAKKQENMKRIFEQRQKERALVESYIVDGKIQFNKLPVISNNVRQILLRWLVQARIRKNYSAQNEYGVKYKVIEPVDNEMCLVKCDDGTLTMPSFTLEFDVEE